MGLDRHIIIKKEKRKEKAKVRTNQHRFSRFRLHFNGEGPDVSSCPSPSSIGAILILAAAISTIGIANASKPLPDEALKFISHCLRVFIITAVKIVVAVAVVVVVVVVVEGGRGLFLGQVFIAADVKLPECSIAATLYL